MQTQEQAEAAAYSCVLGQAERHMEDAPATGGKCWQCDSYHEIQSSDELTAGLRRQLEFCGACVSDDSVTIVDRSEWHSWDECWEEDTRD